MGLTSSGIGGAFGGAYFVDDALRPEHLLGLREVIAHVPLVLYPPDVPLDAVGQVHLRFVTGLAGAGDVRRKVAHLSGSKLSSRRWLYRYIESLGYHLRDLADRGGPAAAHVYRQAVEHIALGGEQVGAGGVSPT